MRKNKSEYFTVVWSQMEQDRLPRRLMKIKEEGWKARGRLRSRWLDGIKEGIGNREYVYKQIEEENLVGQRTMQSNTSQPPDPVNWSGMRICMHTQYVVCNQQCLVCGNYS